MYESPDGQQRQAACETVGSTVRDVWSTTPEVRQSVVLWKQLDGNRMRLTSSEVASVDLVAQGYDFPSALACGGRGSEYGHSPQWAASLPSLPLGCQSTRANGSTDVLLGDPLGGAVPFLVGLGELNGPRRPGQQGNHRAIIDAGSGTGGSITSDATIND